MRHTLARLGALIRAHRRGEEAVAEAVGISLAWNVLRYAGIVGASAALAAGATMLTVSPPKTYHPAFLLSPKGAAFITREEGVRYSPYNDPWNCTVGVGHLIHMGACTASDYVRWRITPAQSTALLIRDADSAETAVRTSVTRPIDQPQFDALVSFAFNVGNGGFASSAIVRAIDSGDLAAVPALLTRYSYASGRFLQGLYNRRVAEGRLFATGDYGAGIGKYVPPRPLTAKQRLRLRTGYWAWVAWYLGEGSWKPYGAHSASTRPHVPARIPAAWWRRERVLVAARHP